MEVNGSASFEPDVHASAVGKNIVFYDGVCGLCNRFIQFVIDNDKDGLFFFAALQNDFAKKTLSKFGIDANALDTVYILSNYADPAKQRLYNRSDAIIFATGQLKNWIRPFSAIIKLVPKPLRDFGYKFVASIRYKLFGKYDTCMLPTAETRARFID